VPGVLVGLLANAVLGGWAGAKGALEGCGLALGLLLPFVLLRGLGAGDWKLMGALGAFLRVSNILLVLVGAIFIGGIMALVEIIRKRRIKTTLANLWVLICTFATFGLATRDHVRPTLDNSELLTLPFGVAVALATTIILCAKSAFLIL
jgi:prepilin peptidase CpaA